MAVTARAAAAITMCFKSPCEDVHPSLGQLTGYKVGDEGLPTSSPWRDTPPTLVGSSLIIVRLAQARVVRPLLAFEVMQLIGWHSTRWNTSRPFSPQRPMPSTALCVELAGNAFSGFAMVPLVSCLAACAGALNQLRDDARRVSKVAQPPPSRARQLRASLSCSSYGSGSDGD
jgi:hypothetical protein